MSYRELLIDLYKHMEWADAAVWAAVLTSDAAQGDTAVVGRLQHIHLVQRAFLSVWREEPIDPHAGEGLGSRELAAWAKGYYAMARAHIAQVTDDAFDTTVRVPWTRQVAQRLGFEPGATSLAETLVQVYGHTTHHRGQVTARLRELGVEPPLVDYIAWLWRGRPEPDWPSDC